MNDEGGKILMIVFAGIALIAIIAFGFFENWGRERVMQCKGGTSLWSPGTHNNTWKIRERTTCSDTDGGSYSCWKTVAKYTDEAYARNVCKTGEY